MKILELHKWEPKPKIQICPRCRTKFEYNERDIVCVPTMSQLGNIYGANFVICPSCAKSIKVEKGDNE